MVSRGSPSSRAFAPVAAAWIHGYRQPRNHRKHYFSVNPSASASPAVSDGERSNSNICILLPFEDDFYAKIEPSIQDLANQLSLPVFEVGDELSMSPGYTHCLSFTPYEFQDISSFTVGICSLGAESVGKQRSKKPKRRNIAAGARRPLFVDFCPGNKSMIGKRIARGRDNKGGELILKAVGFGRNKGASVYDLTAGLGQDSLLMANGGADAVKMVEKDPIVACLLQDALRRLHLVANSTVGGDDKIMKESRDLYSKLTLEIGDSVEIAGRAAEQVDICYLDPMFPPRTKSAAVKKNMSILHGLLETQCPEEDLDVREEREADLLEAAFRAAGRKVVVKRPLQAPPLGGERVKRKPSSVIKGSVNRWDVYAC